MRYNFRHEVDEAQGFHYSQVQGPRPGRTSGKRTTHRRGKSRERDESLRFLTEGTHRKAVCPFFFFQRRQHGISK